jgi:hypothetical protein
MAALRHPHSQAILVSRMIALAVVASLASVEEAAAQDSMRYYTFQGRDAVVTCGQGRSDGQTVRTILKRGTGWFERDLRPTNDTWVSSGCAGYIAEQSRVVSSDEVRERMQSILTPPAPPSYQETMRSLTATLCARNPDHRDCPKS